MKNIAKILCFVLSLVLVFSVIGISTFAEETSVAKIGDTTYTTLKAAFDAAVEGDTIELLAGTISEGTVKLPSTLKNITLKGAADHASILKDMTIMASDGNSYSYEGLTFDGIAFENSRILFTGWRNDGPTLSDLTITNCIFKNLDDTTNSAAVHLNLDINEAVNNFTFTNNVIDGLTGGSKSGIYGTFTGNVIFTNNVINNVSFRPILAQLADCDGVVDNLVVTDNTFSGSAKGRLQIYGSEVENADGTYTPVGTDKMSVVINENVFKGITSTQQICTWGINAETASISNNYYDIDITANPTKIYWNNIAPTTTAGLAELGVFPIYTELNEDGTINTESASDPVVAKIGDVKYYSLADAIAAVGTGDVVIELLADTTFKYGARMAYGTSETTSLTINGNGHTLSLHQTDSDWGSIGLANADATLIFNNVTIEKVGYGDTNGSWNTHALNITSKLEMNDVTVNQSLCVENDAVLNNVDINEANGYYGLWITAEGQSVTFNGGSITATNGGRGIKVADEYVDSASSVTLNVTDVTFTTAKKAAVLVSSTAGADITATDCDITNVAEDSSNLAWVDEDWADNFGEVTVNGGAASQEGVESFNITVKNEDGAVIAYYKNLDDLFASDLLDTRDDYTVLLTGDVTASKLVDISDSQVGWNFVTEVEGGVKMTFAYADNWNYICYMSIGKGITLEVPYLCVYGGVFDVYGTVNTDYLYGLQSAITVKEGATVNVTTGDKTVQAKNNTWLEVYGTLNAGTVNVWNNNSRASTLIVGGENASLTADHIHAWNGGSATKPNTITVENGATLTATNLQADRGSEITVDNATVIAANIALGYGNNIGTLTMQNGAELQLINGGKINAAANAVVSIDETCKSNVVASSTSASGTVVLYTSLQNALDGAANGETVTLICDIKLTSGLVVNGKSLTIELAGYTVSLNAAARSTDALLSATNSANVTINGTGAMIGNGTAVLYADDTSSIKLTGGVYDSDISAFIATGYRVVKNDVDGTFGVAANSTSPEIGENGNWWIGDVDTGIIAVPAIEMTECAEHGVICWYVNGKCTGIQAVGTDVELPEIAIIDGYWYIDNKDGKGLLPTGIKAEGAEGITIVSINRDEAASDELVNVYVVTFSNGQTWSFTVTNGVNGAEGPQGPQGPEGPKGQKGPQGKPGADANDNNKTVIIIIAISTVCIIFTLSVVLYRGVGRRSWWCTR